MFPVSAGRSMALSFALGVTPHDTLARAAMTIPRRQFLHIAAAGLALPALPQGDAASLLGAWTLNRETVCCGAK
jgi:hypothetical protein